MLILDQLTIEFSSGIPVYKQIVNWIRSEVLGGRMQAGDRLPTIRGLTESLGVNPNTVAKAYRELELSGLITSRRGDGSYVNTTDVSSTLTQEEVRRKLDELYERFASEARSFGITEEDVQQYLPARRKRDGDD